MSTFDQNSSSMGNLYFILFFLWELFNISLDIDSSAFDHLLEEDWAVNYTPTLLETFKTNQHNLTIPKLNQLIESWITKREKLTTGFQSVFGKREINNSFSKKIDILTFIILIRTRFVKGNST